MRYSSYTQYCIVTGKTAQELTEQLNAKLYELRAKHPDVTFEGLIARIAYQEEEDVPESLADEYRMQGVKLTCYDCPYFGPTLNRDGSENQRAKKGTCPFKDYKIAYKDAAACNRLFEMLNSGEVRLCIAD